MLADVCGESAVRSAERLMPLEDDPDGWHVLRLRLDWPDELPGRLLSLGNFAEVIGPEDLRAQVAELAGLVADRYSAGRPS